MYSTPVAESAAECKQLVQTKAGRQESHALFTEQEKPREAQCFSEEKNLLPGLGTPPRCLSDIFCIEKNSSQQHVHFSCDQETKWGYERKKRIDFPKLASEAILSLSPPPLLFCAAP